MALPFSAHCQRGHDRVDFTDRAAFEQHMMKTHKARKHTTGGACWNGARIPALDTARPGGLPNKYLRPSRAPKGTEGLTKVLSEYDHWGKNMDGLRGAFAGVANDWQTDERVTLADVRTGDVFRMGRHEYTCTDRDAWLVTGPGAETPTRPRNIEDRLGAEVVIVKRAA